MTHCVGGTETIAGADVEYIESKEGTFVRLDPGELLIKTLTDLAAQKQIRTAFLCTGVGMLTDPSLGFFDVEKDNYDIKVLPGLFDLNAVQGNITWTKEGPVPHVHLMFNDRSFRTFGGHLMEAKCHITMELLLVRSDGLDLRREKLVGVPATRICPIRPGEHRV